MSRGRWRSADQLRCGICDQPFARGDRTTVVDDERVHVECAKDYEVARDYREGCE